MVSKQDEGPIQINANNKPIIQVNHFKYLGSCINGSLDPDEELKTKIQMARSAFMRLKAIFCNPQQDPQQDLQLRSKFLKCNVYLDLLYGSETWIMTVNMVNRLRALKIRFSRISVVEVLKRIN